MSHFQTCFDDKCPLYMKNVFEVLHRPSLNKKLYYETKSTAKDNQLWSALYISFLAPSVWNNLQNELKRCTNSAHLRQNFLYSKDVNKNPP